MLDVREEKKLINNLLQKLINNRREINRYYDELIERLDVLIISEQSSTNTISEIKRSVSIMEREKYGIKTIYLAKIKRIIMSRLIVHQKYFGYFEAESSTSK